MMMAEKEKRSEEKKKKKSILRSPSSSVRQLVRTFSGRGQDALLSVDANTNTNANARTNANANANASANAYAYANATEMATKNNIPLAQISLNTMPFAMAHRSGGSTPRRTPKHGQEQENVEQPPKQRPFFKSPPPLRKGDAPKKSSEKLGNLMKPPLSPSRVSLEEKWELKFQELHSLLAIKNAEVESIRDNGVALNQICCKQEEEISKLKSVFPEIMLETTHLRELCLEQERKLNESLIIIPSLQQRVVSLTEQLKLTNLDLTQLKSLKDAQSGTWERAKNFDDSGKLESESDQQIESIRDLNQTTEEEQTSLQHERGADSSNGKRTPSSRFSSFESLKSMLMGSTPHRGGDLSEIKRSGVPRRKGGRSREQSWSLKPT